MIRLLSLPLLLLLLLAGCGSATESDRKRSTPPTTRKAARRTVAVPNFNADTAYHYVSEQVALGPRIPNTMGHQLCGDWIVATLRSQGAKVIEQPFTTTLFNGESIRGRNLVGSFYPEKGKRLLLMAHWDTRPFADQAEDEAQRNQPILGANDAASGVAVLLEIGRILAQNDTPAVGIDLLFFDVEDYGAPNTAREDLSGKPTSYCLGSQHWGESPHQPNYQAYYGILLDMVGAEGAKFYWEGYSAEYASSVLELVWDQAHQAGYGDYFVRKRIDGLIDDHLFVNRLANIPTIDIIHHDPVNGDPFFAHWHKPTDDLSQIRRETLEAVGQTLLHVIYSEPDFQ